MEAAKVGDETFGCLKSGGEIPVEVGIVYPIVFGVSYIPGGWEWDFSHQQYDFLGKQLNSKDLPTIHDEDFDFQIGKGDVCSMEIPSMFHHRQIFSTTENG